MKVSAHTRAVVEAVFVTFLWSTSWVLIKIGLADIPALLFAGLRYFFAFLCLLPFILRPARLAALRGLSRRKWSGLLLLGVIFYAVTQGTQFVGLAYLPAVSVSLLLTLTVIVVPLLGIVWLSENLLPQQWSGIAFFVLGAAIFFYPIALPAGEAIGFVVVLIGVLANALSAVLGRQINRDWNLDPLLVTVVSMGIGSAVLLAAGLWAQGMPTLAPIHWMIIVWLAIVNTALAFTLWNRTLQTLTATESSIINNTMLVQIALLAWIFLGEALTALKIAGMLLAMVGALLVQIRMPGKILDTQTSIE
jgi:drug/metabolite transporter (DMT)-like permease